jgi:aspartate oxidase
MQNLEDPKNFNNFKQRAIYARAQLTFIEQYLLDFQTIVKNMMEKFPTIKEEIKKKKDNNEII